MSARGQSKGTRISITRIFLDSEWFSIYHVRIGSAVRRWLIFKLASLKSYKGSSVSVMNDITRKEQRIVEEQVSRALYSGISN